ncbi:acyltransferase [Xylariales sp. PMI_506]|nr:acyltransferase [Xylariales sp. PMI_506]
MSLIDEKSLSDIESEGGRVDLESRFPQFGPQQWAGSARSYWRGLRFSSWPSVIIRMGAFLLPSFLHPHYRGKAERLGPTAYLDGMRGLAAFFVFFCHYFYSSFTIAEGWGHNQENYDIWKLPFIRLLFSGPSMVCLFFVISGYALSYKPLKQIRNRSFEGFATTMSSFVFRRLFRLYIPTAVSTFGVLLLLQAGVYEKTREFAEDTYFIRNVVEHHPELKDTFYEQFMHWVWEMYEFIHIWGWEKFGGTTGYDVHLWTIPVEFRCSMMLFLVLFGVARLRTAVRFFCLACIGWFCLRNDRWEMVLFLSGMAIAELDIIRGAHNPPAQAASAGVLPFEEKPTPKSKKTKGALWIILSVVAMYLMSEPDIGPYDTPGWGYLGEWIPEYFSDKYRYWQMWGGILFVYCVARSPPWQRFFNTPVVQYLGKISYAIYLMHGPVIHTAGFMIEEWAWSITGAEGSAYTNGFILASIFNIPLVIWAADVFCRLVDVPSVKFSRWIEARCIARE